MTSPLDTLRLPMVCAPMFLISGPELVIAACRAGIAGAFPTPNCGTVEELDSFTTGEGTLYFLAKDQTGQYETGAPVRWIADLKIRYQVDPAADKRRVTLACTPKADIFLYFLQK